MRLARIRPFSPHHGTDSPRSVRWSVTPLGAGLGFRTPAPARDRPKAAFSAAFRLLGARGGLTRPCRRPTIRKSALPNHSGSGSGASDAVSPTNSERGLRQGISSPEALLLTSSGSTAPATGGPQDRPVPIPKHWLPPDSSKPDLAYSAHARDLHQPSGCKRRAGRCGVAVVPGEPATHRHGIHQPEVR